VYAAQEAASLARQPTVYLPASYPSARQLLVALNQQPTMSSHASSNGSSGGSSRPHRRHHRHHKSAGRPLVVLHSLNTFFSLVTICGFAAVLPIWNANFFHSTGIIRGDWPDTLPILPLFITFTASFFYLTKLWLARRRTAKSIDYIKSRSKPSQPSAHLWKVQVYVTLTTLILLLTFLIIAGVSGLYRFWRPAVITNSMELSSGGASSTLSLNTLSLRRDISDSNPSQTTKAIPHSCTLTNMFTRECNPTLYLIGDLQIASIATGSLVWLINLVLVVFQVREYQYQKRKHQRSLRAKAKAKFGPIEDEISRAEKGEISNKKKIHPERKDPRSKMSSDLSLASQPTANNPCPSVTRPKRARTDSSYKVNAASDHTPVRPKQHYYNPQITPSRSRSTRQAQQEGNASLVPAPLQTTYSRAVEEARRSVKPAETMRDWLDRRYT